MVKRVAPDEAALREALSQAMREAGVTARPGVALPGPWAALAAAIDELAESRHFVDRYAESADLIARAAARIGALDPRRE
jgi:hypothetical protein